MININTRHLVAILLLLVIITGCNNNTDSNVSITSIGLECPKTTNDELCESKYLDDAQSIKIFEEAINKAIKMQGILNYVAEYNMTISNSNNTTKNYHLSLGTDRLMNGLLVDQSNSGQGYEIPMKYANQLRDVLKK
ncbi:hypothetical protein [Paenibacillus antarcticus]|uniref:YhfM-like domain-containing protein n=1 Tax=Paenibacillus antarcticus TaxID=253703 RepID=A0A168KQL9_9BACL|nr:hypothetical protein [Paenibacillus antarcticus]OAB42339.1 hypothetical protein PBAT_20280 [Paenibacillus antarcticus]